MHVPCRSRANVTSWWASVTHHAARRVIMRKLKPMLRRYVEYFLTGMTPTKALPRHPVFLVVTSSDGVAVKPSCPGDKTVPFRAVVNIIFVASPFPEDASLLPPPTSINRQTIAIRGGKGSKEGW
ncbi:hypothetical protein LMG29542_02307 [Paraburkholderia humisilvae]|uniref:Uncharacterized protein n=1 Tax=Paraburkholderia humisilvae TaxID=627669 RepID=A0A6J5DJH1_9BURK|nr:hypothetical protein LMG29542_02307 [Paraburkholderia humisilvae]